MKITLDTQELNQAVVSYLESLGLTVDTAKLDICITADGVTIDTNKSQAKAEPVKADKKAKDKVKETKEPKPVIQEVETDEAVEATESVEEVEAPEPEVKAKANPFSPTLSFAQQADTVDEPTHQAVAQQTDKPQVRKLFA